MTKYKKTKSQRQSKKYRIRELLQTTIANDDGKKEPKRKGSKKGLKIANLANRPKITIGTLN